MIRNRPAEIAEEFFGQAGWDLNVEGSGGRSIFLLRQVTYDRFSGGLVLREDARGVRPVLERDLQILQIRGVGLLVEIMKYDGFGAVICCSSYKKSAEGAVKMDTSPARRLLGKSGLHAHTRIARTRTNNTVSAAIIAEGGWLRRCLLHIGAHLLITIEAEPSDGFAIAGAIRAALCTAAGSAAISSDCCDAVAWKPGVVSLASTSPSDQLS